MAKGRRSAGRGAGGGEGLLELAASFKLDFKEAQEDIEDFQNKLKKGFSDAVAASMALGPKRNTKIHDDIKELGQALQKAYAEFQSSETKAQETFISDTERAQRQADVRIAKGRYGDLKKRWDDEMRIVDRRKKAEEEAAERLNGQLSQATQTFGEGMHGVFQDIMSKDVGNLAGLFSKLAKASQTASHKAQEAAQGREGKSGDLMKGLGSFLAKIGPTLAAIAAVAAGFAAVIKILIDADAQAKDFNRTLMESGVAGGGLSSTLGGMEETLRKTRDLFMNHPLYNFKWGVTPKDLAKIQGEFEEVGMAFGEYTQKVEKAKTDQDALGKAIESTLTYSKLFNMSTSEIAKQYNTYMEDLGMTVGIISERFSELLSVARESGFGVKRFFSMISQATSGMTLYNVRIAEAVSLLDAFAKAVGKEKAGELLKTVNEQFRDMDPSERIKRVKLMGEKYAKKTLQTDTQKMAASVLESIKGVMATPKGAGLKPILEEMFRGDKFGGYAKVMSSPENFNKAVGQMDEGELAKFNMAIGAYNEDLVHVARSFELYSKAVAGGNLQGALPYAGFQANTKMALGALQTLFKGRSIGQIDLARDKGESEKAAEMVLNIGPGRFRELFNLDRQYIDAHLTLMDEATKISKAAPEDQARMIKEFNNTFAKSMGVALDLQDGKVIRRKAEFDNEGKPIGEIVEDTKDALVDLIKVKPAELSKDTQMAIQIAENTRDFTQILETGVQAVLNHIYNVVTDIRDILFIGRRKLEGAEKTAQQQAADEIATVISDSQKEVMKAQHEQRDLAKQLKKAETPEEQAAIETKIRDAKRREDEARGRERVGREQRRRVVGVAELQDVDEKVRPKLKTKEEWLEFSAREQVAKLEEEDPLREGAEIAGEIAARNERERLRAHPEEVYSETILEGPSSSPKTIIENKVEEARQKAMADYINQGQKKLIAPTATANAVANWDEYDRRKQAKIAAILKGSDQTMTSDMAIDYGQALGRPIPDVKVWESLTDAQRQLIRDSFDPGDLPGLKDGFISHGGVTARIDTNDDVLAFQRGGPIARAMGTGTTVNNITLVGAGPRDLLNGLINAMDAGVIH